jgi:hypothetical protein
VIRAGLAAALLLAGCDRAARTGDADLQVRWSFEPSTPEVGTAEVRLKISDVDWTPRNGATVIVSGTRDGVVLSVDTARGEGAGQYVAPKFRFEVAGDWVLRARIETPDRRWVEVERTVKVGTGGS